MNELTSPGIGSSTLHITPSSRMILHPLTYREEGEEYIVSCPGLSIFLSMPLMGVEALRLLEQGKTVEEVAQQLQSGDEEPPDIIDFVHTLIEDGLVAEVNGYRFTTTVIPDQKQLGLNILPWIQGKHVRWLFGKTAFIIYGVMIFSCVLLLLRQPHNVPNMMDMMMMSPSYTVNTLVMLGTSVVLILVHELGHIFAARAMGIDGRLGLGRRLFYIVSQSYVDELWQLPRHKRMVVYLGGMVTNLIGLFFGLVLLTWQGMALSPAIYMWLKLFLFIEWFALEWQFFMYMKTDIYYVVADVFRAWNLMDDARAFIGNALAKVWPKWFAVCDLSSLSKREYRFVQMYAIFYIGGIIYASYILISAVIPFIGGIIAHSIESFSLGPKAGVGPLLDAVVGIVSYSIYLGLLGWVLWTQRPRRLQSLPPIVLEEAEQARA